MRALLPDPSRWSVRSALFSIALVAGLPVIVPLSARSETWLVRPDGAGDFPTIQAAINGASPGDIIELADGTFAGDGNRDLDCHGKAITVRSQAGSAQDCVIDCEGSAGAPHRGFVFHSGEGPSTRLEAVTIENGYTPGATGQQDGGGLRCLNSSPTISGCVFRDCYAVYHGGGAFFAGSASTLDFCIFESNEAFLGGGLHCESGCLAVNDCVFAANHAHAAGGLYLLAGGSASLARSRFLDNTATASGAGAAASDSPGATFVECEFLGGTVSGHGGAIWWTGANAGSQLILERCILSACTSGSYGGAIYAVAPAGTITVDRCTIYRASGDQGGGIYSHSNTTLVRLMNTIIAEGTRGAAAVVWGPHEIACCDFHGNLDGDWTGSIAGELGVDGNIAEDPLFCAPLDGNLSLRADSPCAPFTPPNAQCDQIGARPVGCAPTPVRRASWGEIKFHYGE